MKYEFIKLEEDFKSNQRNFYLDENKDICIDLTEIFKINKKLKFPIGIFINGILLESVNYSFAKNKVVINKDYPVYSTDRIYMIFTSSSAGNSGYISQYKLYNFNVLDDTTVNLKESLVLQANKTVIAVIVNGILYSTDLFKLNANTITFNRYRPDEKDDLSILILNR